MPSDGPTVSRANVARDQQIWHTGGTQLRATHDFRIARNLGLIPNLIGET
jgi:hypothetical protein